MSISDQNINISIPKNEIPSYLYDDLYTELIVWPLDMYTQVINSKYKTDLFLSNVFEFSIKYKSTGEKLEVSDL